MKILFATLFILAQIVYGQNFSVNEKIVKTPKDKNDFATLLFEVKDEKGETLYSISENIPYDLPYPSLHLFKDGASVLVNAFNATVKFFDKNGAGISMSRLSKRLEYKRAILTDCGTEKAVFVSTAPFEENAKIFLFDKNGNPIFEKEAPFKLPAGVRISSNDSLFAVSGVTWTNRGQKKFTDFYNDKGELFFETEKYFQRGEFFANNTKFLGWFEMNLFVISLKDKQLLTDIVPSNGNYIATSFADKFIYFVTYRDAKFRKGKFEFRDLYLNKYSLNGQLISMKKLEIKKAYNIGFKRNNAVYLNVDNKIILCK